MIHRTYFECVCSFNVTGKWHLEEEYGLKIMPRLQACDWVVSRVDIKRKRESCLEIIAGTSQTEGKESWDCSVHRKLQGYGREAEA